MVCKELNAQVLLCDGKKFGCRKCSYSKRMSQLYTVICCYFAGTNDLKWDGIKRNLKHSHMPAPASYAHVYWFNTGLPFILSGSVSCPPEYTIATLLLHEWTSVRLTARLVPFQAWSRFSHQDTLCWTDSGSNFLKKVFWSQALFLLWALYIVN